MSQPDQVVSVEVQLEIDDLIGEIAFQRVLLESIDDTVQNRHEAELEVRKEIRNLESQVKRLKRGTTGGTPTASNYSNSASSQVMEAPAPSSSPKIRPLDAGFLSEAPTDAFQAGPDQRHSLFTPNSVASMADIISPSRMKLPSRKRSHSNHLDGALAPFEGYKSRRTSPSPYLTGHSTSSTTTSEDGDVEDFEREYKDRLRLEEQRRWQEKADEDFARIMQESIQSAPENPPTLPRLSAFDRISGIRPPPSSSATSSNPNLSRNSQHMNPSRRLPWPQQTPSSSVSVKPEPQANSMHSRVKFEHSSGLHPKYNSFGSNQTVKRDSGTSEPSSSYSMPGSFREESDSDSDIEIIPASAFYRNKPVPKTEPKTEPHRFSFGGEGPANRYSSNGALQTSMYSKHSRPHEMNIPGPSTQTGMSMNPLSNPYGINSGNYVYPGMFAGHQLALGDDFWPTDTDLLPGYPNANLHFSQLGLGYNAYAEYGRRQPAASQSFMQADPLADIIARSSGNNYVELVDYLNADEHMSNHIDHIMNDPRKTGDEIKTLLENIKPDLDLPPEEREGTPDGMKYPLYEHQKIALSWLKAMEEGTNKGGILADDMGLGKTISSLALILSRPSSDRARKTTLIVGPVALVRQWEQEIRKKINSSHRLSTYLLHGQSRKASWDEIQTHDIVMTTYGTLAHEHKAMERWIESQKAENRGEYDLAPMKKLFPLLGPKSHFYRVILDEAQSIKNKATGAAKAACALKSVYRLCLTGTPMMNNVGELYSLIHFLRIRPYNEWHRFQQEFGCLTKYDHKNKNRDYAGAMRKLQAIIKAILLRRTKKSLIDGKPIINLPGKTEEIQHVVFNEDEQAYYKALESKTQIQFNRYLRAGTVGKNYSNILVLLLRLRQACCHPHLIMDFEEAPIGADMDPDTMITLAKSLSPDVVSRLLEIEAFECPVCYDVAENPRIIVPCGHDTCSECLTKISDQAVQQHVAEGNNGVATCKCPTCRGDLKMDSIIDFTTFKKVYKPDQAATANGQIGNETESESDDSEAEDETDSEDEIDSSGDLRGFIVPDDRETEDDMETEDEIQDDDDGARPPSKTSKNKSKSKKEKRRRIKGKGKKKEKSAHVTLAMLKKQASQSAEYRRQYMRYLRKNWEPSAKIDKCVELLEQFQNDGQKTIIFSQFVTLLDLIQVPLDQKKWKPLRYDGSMSADRRNEAINTFTDKADHNIMLISLKAGNAGLNLVAASRVIILDPFWNPFIEMQAIDRAYRIGQQNPVEVHRILIEGTVEDRIIELQERKRRLVESALDEGANKDIGRLDVRQLAYLFGVGMGN